jgi:hypothetical protein
MRLIIVNDKLEDIQRNVPGIKILSGPRPKRGTANETDKYHSKATSHNMPTFWDTYFS